MIRSFLSCTVFISLCFCQNEVQHIVMNLDGTSAVGLIDSMNTESVFITAEGAAEQTIYPLKDIYYIYNSFGKLYYISPNYEDRLNLIEERSGFLVTIVGDTIDYTSIEIERRMDEPYVYLTTVEDDLAHKLSLFDVHLIRIDASYMEHSVRRGCITGACLMLTGLAMQTLSYYGDRRKNLPDDASLFQKSKTMGGALGTSIMNFIPGLSSAGQQYQSVTVILPLSTIGWMAYDLYFDKRTHYFRPLIREDNFPHSMYWFNPWRIVKNKIKEKMEPLIEKIEPILEKLPF
ncbi:MAG TPA: hypothetical protein EYO52_06665 [Candidatus Marinimicrobia bacterium]|nr:hypothetical protein [Candidatus Neomarinimicrobiota bacterium]